MTEKLKHIDTILFDLDGTLYFKGEQIPNADETLKKLRAGGYKLNFITNTDGRSPESIQQRLSKMGIEIDLGELLTPVTAVKAFMEERSDKSCFCLVSDEVEQYLKTLNINKENPDYIIIGDFSDKITFELMNQVFRYIKSGAEMLALSKSPYYFTQEGVFLNTGAFVSLYEIACEKEACLMGKPSKAFFETALRRLGSCAENTLIVGDDIGVDIVGAKNLGAKGVQVKTGHFSEAALRDSSVKPDFVIEDVSRLPELLSEVLTLIEYEKKIEG